MLEAAESVCAGEGIEPAEVLDLLAGLVNKSLVVAGGSKGGETRYRLLETIRQYAQAKIGALRRICRNERPLPALFYGVGRKCTLSHEQNQSIGLDGAIRNANMITCGRRWIGAWLRKEKWNWDCA